MPYNSNSTNNQQSTKRVIHFLSEATEKASLDDSNAYVTSDDLLYAYNIWNAQGHLTPGLERFSSLPMSMTAFGATLANADYRKTRMWITVNNAKGQRPGKRLRTCIKGIKLKPEYDPNTLRCAVCGKTGMTLTNRGASIGSKTFLVCQDCDDTLIYRNEG